MSSHLTNGVFRSADVTGGNAAGFLLNAYVSGTTTRQATYTSEALTTPNANPVVLNARGEAKVWLTPGLSYTFTLTDPGGAVVWSEDGIAANESSSGSSSLRAALASTASGSGTALVGSNDAGAYFAGTTAEAQLQDLGRSRKLLEVYADVTADGSDQNTALQAYLTTAKSLGARLRLPVGTIGFSNTLTIDSTVEIVGAGIGKSILLFINSTAGKSAIKLSGQAIRSKFADFDLQDATFGTSCGIELTDSIAAGGGVQKIAFTRVSVTGFDIGHKYTSASPLAGNTHAMCSETVWLHCRFVINRLAMLNQNCQAYNNRYIGCDVENFDTTYRGSAVTDASFDMFSDEAGGGFFLEGGSYIGRGKLYKWKYPTGGTVLWSGGTFAAQNIRMEARSTHNGVIVNEEVHGVTGSLALNLDFKNIDITTSSQNLDFLRYGGRVNGRIENVFPTAGTGSLTVRQYPTLGRTSNTNTGSQGGIELVDHALLRVVETSSPYGGGGYAASATGRLTSHGARSASTNSGMSVDAQGFFFLTGPGDAQQLGMQLNGLTSASKLIWNNDLVTSGFASDIKIILPKGGRPLKLIAYKHATQFAANVGFKLYMVKDNANWVNPAAFAVATDALLVASMPSTAGAAGYYEVTCVLTANSLGNELRSGYGSWTEGRMLLEKVGGATLFGGFVGVEYL